MEDCSYYKDPKKTNCIINIPSDFAKSSLFYLQEIGEQNLLSTQVSKGENYLSYLFFVVTDGQGKLEYGDTSYVMSVGECGFLDCQKPYSYYAFHDILSLKYIYFNGSSMANIYGEYQKEGGFPCFRVHNSGIYLELLKQIYDIASSASGVKDMEIYTKLMSLLALLMSAGKSVVVPERKIPQKQNVNYVKEYLEQNYKEKITLDQLSEKFYINKFYLTRLFRETFGISVNNYLIQVRIAHAKILLGSSDMSVEKIGFECGIGNANYFTKVFKKWEGMPPGEYRKKKRTQTASEKTDHSKEQE